MNAKHTPGPWYFGNASLIAAAPDLLAALEGLVKWIDEGRIACDLTFYSEPARAAIAKATGK